MRGLRLFVLLLGVANLLAAAAFYFGAGFVVGMAWLGAYDLYADLDIHGIIDSEKLADFEDGRYAKDRDLGEHLVTLPSGAASKIVAAGTGLLGANGVVLILSTIFTRPARKLTGKARLL